MDLGQLAKAAVELGVIPALALFLVVAMFLQNRQLIKDRREIEMHLLKTLLYIVQDTKSKGGQLQLPEIKTPVSSKETAE